MHCHVIDMHHLHIADKVVNGVHEVVRSEVGRMSMTRPIGVRVAFAQPLYTQVRAQILIRITSGEWSAGDALPNEFALAAEYGVSVGTIRKAVEGLEEQGLLIRKQGRGTYVAGSGRNPLEQKFTSVRAPNGDPPEISYQLEQIRRRPCWSSEANVLGCEPGSEIVEIEQAVQLGTGLVGMETAVVSAAMFPRLETQLVYGQHLYSVYSLYGILVTRASDLVSVTSDYHEMAKRLGLANEATLLIVKRMAFTHDRQPVEYRTSYYSSAKVSYSSLIA